MNRVQVVLSGFNYRKDLFMKVINLHFYNTIIYTSYGEKDIRAYINEEEKIYIGGHFILDCSISDWRKGYSLCSCPIFQSNKMCIYLNLLSKEHIYIYINRLILLMYAFNE